jgi:RAD3-like DEAD/DEAH box helicase
LAGKLDSAADASWADKLPTPEFAKIRDEFRAVDIHVPGQDLRHGWSMLRDHLHACQLYLSSQDILLRPLVPPTWTHAPFGGAKQRIFMSATLGAGGDLERLTGCTSIKRLPVPGGWDRQGIGRRYFIFPGMSLKEDEATQLRRELMKRAGRSLVLVPSDRVRDHIVKDINDNLGFKVFGADDIEESKKTFVAEPKAVAVVANRYDGIDFPGNDCRLLFLDGLPRAMNTQERFLMTRMGANVLFNERVQTRVLQAIGRCTRSLEDFSAVVVSGEDVPNYLADRQRRMYLHPELQAELDFGIEQSQGTKLNDLVENFDTFLRNDVEWEAANGRILAKRASVEQQPFPAIDELQDVVSCEIEFQKCLWQGDYETALSAAERALAGLTASELKGYRALWHYLAGSAAWLASQRGVSSFSAKARDHFAAAKKAASDIPWLVELSRYCPATERNSTDRSVLFGQLERLEPLLAGFGKLHDRKFDSREKEIIEGLASTSKGPFEAAHVLLGEMLGFSVGKREVDASPDPWWIAGKICFVFEDHAGAQPTSRLDATKARQVSTHPDWIRANVPLSEGTEIYPVLVTPVTRAEDGARPHLVHILLWPLDEFREWAKQALSVLRDLRRTFREPGDLVWRSQAAEVFERHGLDAPTLLRKLQGRRASAILKKASAA